MAVPRVLVRRKEGKHKNVYNGHLVLSKKNPLWFCLYRTFADKASKLESTVEVYRKKLEDLNDFRRQVKSLQETNMMYMHNTVSLEEELKKANAARAQLETYKRQVRNSLFFTSCALLSFLIIVVV